MCTNLTETFAYLVLNKFDICVNLPTWPMAEVDSIFFFFLNLEVDSNFR